MGIVSKLTNESSIKNRKEILKHTTFIALGKGKARKRKGKVKGEQEYISYFSSAGDIKYIPLQYDTIDRFLILLRDEAHRFANAYRKKRMAKEYK